MKLAPVHFDATYFKVNVTLRANVISVPSINSCRHPCPLSKFLATNTVKGQDDELNMSKPLFNHGLYGGVSAEPNLLPGRTTEASRGLVQRDWPCLGDVLRALTTRWYGHVLICHLTSCWYDNWLPVDMTTDHLLIWTCVYKSPDFLWIWQLTTCWYVTWLSVDMTTDYMLLWPQKPSVDMAVNLLVIWLLNTYCYHGRVSIATDHMLV